MINDIRSEMCSLLGLYAKNTPLFEQKTHSRTIYNRTTLAQWLFNIHAILWRKSEIDCSFVIITPQPNFHFKCTLGSVSEWCETFAFPKWNNSSEVRVWKWLLGWRSKSLLYYFYYQINSFYFIYFLWNPLVFFPKSPNSHHHEP